MTHRTCAQCGDPLSAKSKYVHQCGRCAKSRLMLAKGGQHECERTHPHGPRGAGSSIEMGVRCTEACPRWGENGPETGHQGTNGVGVGTDATATVFVSLIGYSEGAA